MSTKRYYCLNLLIVLISIFTIHKSRCEVISASKSPALIEEANKINGTQNLTLTCQPGEQRHFSYESTTKVWTTSNHAIKILANLRIRCIDQDATSKLSYLTNKTLSYPKGSLKYLAEILNLNAQEVDDKGKEISQSREGTGLSGKGSIDNDSGLQAEPLLEEVGEAISEAATRMRRSVSNWFSKAWLSVKDFFSNIFTSTERSSVSREQVLNEYGIDISNQCSSSNKRRSSGGLPIDDTYFEDLDQSSPNRKFYISPSLDPSTKYDILESRVSGPEVGRGSDISEIVDEDETNERLLSFFNDPIMRAQGDRSKRDSDIDHKGGYKKQHLNFNKEIKLPFVFVQSAKGKILEIHFASEDTDVAVKNFKRHLCDLFATNLANVSNNNKKNKPILRESDEISPIGDHKTKYLLDTSSNSTVIKDALKDRPKPHLNEQLSKAVDELEQDASRIKATHVAASLGSSKTYGPPQSDLPVASSGEGRELPAPSSGDFSVSILRTINTTSQVVYAQNSKFLDDHDDPIDEMQIDMKQVQQISDGRLTGTAGEMSMSLASIMSKDPSRNNRKKRNRIARSDGNEDRAMNDLTELVQVTTTFSVKMVPAPEREARRAKRAANDSLNAAANRTAIVRPPEDPKKLKRLMEEWTNQMSELRLTKSALKNEIDSGPESRMRDRLELLRDQVQMRLNEEFIANRMRRVAKSAALALEQAVKGQKMQNQKSSKTSSSGDLGLSLTQIILDSGSTKHKGSVYSTLEEIIDLESSLDEYSSTNSMSRLLRDTLKADKLRSHCKSSILSLEQMEQFVGKTESKSKIEMRHPFGIEGDKNENIQLKDSKNNKKFAKMVNSFAQENQKRLDQCTNVLVLLLQVNARQAGDLVIDMIDECNQRISDSSKFEELGYGPLTRYYRHIRRRFIEMTSNIKRPTEGQLDKLISRLHQFDRHFSIEDSDQKQSSTTSQRRKPNTSLDHGTDFVFVSSNDPKKNSSNKTTLRVDDDYNNWDGSALMMMTITALASRPSISRVKRVQIIEKLMTPLKNSTCSHLNGPDLDILEAMSNFRSTPLDDPQPIDELVGRVIQLTRRCSGHDQYLIGSIHALQGQLRHRSTQRFLAEQLRSANVSCSVKREVILSLIGSILLDNLDDSWRQEPIPSDERQASLRWPSIGYNALDDLMLEMVEIQPSKRDQLARFESDRRCLRQLVAYYMSKKHPINSMNETHSSPQAIQNRSAKNNPRSDRRSLRARTRRNVRNEDKFWDQAECKKWTVNLNDTSTFLSSPSSSFDFVEGLLPGESNETESRDASRTDQLRSATETNLDFDDSILASIARSRLGTSTKLASRANQKLVERESDWPPPSSIASPFSITSAKNQEGKGNSSNPEQTLIRRRHKCTASKKFGPKNAEANLRAEVVNDLVGSKDENKFLARISLIANFLGKKINVGRMYLWHQKRMTRAHVNILGKNLWDSSQSCLDKAPNHLTYMPLFDLNLWLVKLSIGLRLESEMGFYTECSRFFYDSTPIKAKSGSNDEYGSRSGRMLNNDELQVFPTISVRASGEATARLVVARAGLSLASQYGYQGNIKVSRQPDSCMSIESAHQPMNVTVSSWLQLWDNDCHFWGSRNRAQPQATRWRLNARKPTVWLDDECLASNGPRDSSGNSDKPQNASLVESLITKRRSISP